MARVNIAGTLYPDVADEPTHDESYGCGGYRRVGTEVERDGIPPNYIGDGTLVFTRDDNEITWRWNETNNVWDIFPSSIQTGQINNGAISETKLDNSSVSTRTIQDNAVNTNSIHSGAVTVSKLDSSVTDLYYDKSSSDGKFMVRFTSIPLANDSVGVEGTMAVNSTHLYVCIVGSEVDGSGVWGRVALDTGW